MALLTLDLKGARRLLTQAQKIAEKHGMHRLAAKVSFEHDELLQKLDIWKSLKDTESPIIERLKMTRLNEQITAMTQKRRNEIPEIVEENPVMILVIAEGGIPILSKLFTEGFGAKDDLISSFLSAFNTFSAELFSEGLDRASFGEFTILLNPIPNFLVCYLFKGQSYYAQKKIQKFVKYLKNNIKLLDKFDKFYKTNQVVKPEDLPILNALITHIFIDKIID